MRWPIAVLYSGICKKFRVQVLGVCIFERLNSGPWLVTGQPRHLPQSFLSFLLLLYCRHRHRLKIPRKRTQSWTDCLNHNFFMDIASLVSFSGYGPDKVNSAYRFQLFFGTMCKCIILQFTILTLASYIQPSKKAHSTPSKFLLQLCLLKGSFCCLFFFRGSVKSLLLLATHSLTKALNCSSCSPHSTQS